MLEARWLLRYVRHAGLCVVATSVLAGCAFPGWSSKGRAHLSPFAQTRVGDLHAFVAGDREAVRVIYVHGTPGEASGWINYLQDPVPGTESIAIDRPGFGKSVPLNGPSKPVVSFQAQANAIAPLLVKRDGRWPVLVGHSLGGPIVARLAADHPDRVGGIIILAGSLDPALEDLKWFNHLAATPGLRLLIPKPLRTSNAEIFAAREQTEQLAEVLDQIRCPVVILHGTDDTLVPYANVVYMRRTLTNASRIDLQGFENEGHFLPWRREAEVRSAVEMLLQ